VGVVFVAQHAHAGWATIAKSPLRRLKTEPAGCDHTDDVTTEKRQDIPLNAANPTNKAVGAGGNIIRGLSTRASIAVELPVWLLLQDVLSQFPFKGAVVLLEQFGIDLSPVSKAGQLAGF
jgi:hypothetical protein